MEPTPALKLLTKVSLAGFATQPGLARSVVLGAILAGRPIFLCHAGGTLLRTEA